MVIFIFGYFFCPEILYIIRTEIYLFLAIVISKSSNCNRSISNSTSSTAQGGGGSFKNRKPIGEVGCCESGMAERSH